MGADLRRELKKSVTDTLSDDQIIALARHDAAAVPGIIDKVGVVLLAGWVRELCNRLEKASRRIAAGHDWELLDERAKLNEAREPLPPEGY